MTPLVQLRELAVSNGLTPEAIEQEIAARVEAIKPLIGWLCPNILRNEIDVLYEMLETIRSRDPNQKTARGSLDK
jgi:hypothetical protein